MKKIIMVLNEFDHRGIINLTEDGVLHSPIKGMLYNASYAKGQYIASNLIGTLTTNFTKLTFKNHNWKTKIYYIY